MLLSLILVQQSTIIGMQVNHDWHAMVIWSNNILSFFAQELDILLIALSYQKYRIIHPLIIFIVSSNIDFLSFCYKDTKY
jgi:hypothetical protein